MNVFVTLPQFGGMWHGTYDTLLKVHWRAYSSTSIQFLVSSGIDPRESSDTGTMPPIFRPASITAIAPLSSIERLIVHLISH
jgi:hypothetical protein